ncbi:hypothetical protein HDU90_003419 [Geranomyces variabilis]|nr:hypothetical protein HDU90_003419 [Geranomyces variabilis]
MVEFQPTHVTPPRQTGRAKPDAAQTTPGHLLKLHGHLLHGNPSVDTTNSNDYLAESQ